MRLLYREMYLQHLVYLVTLASGADVGATPSTSNSTSTAAGSIDFSSAVIHEASIANLASQRVDVAAIPLPSNITHYNALSQVAGAMPPIQVYGDDYGIASSDLSHLLAAVVPPSPNTTDSAVNAPGKRQSTRRVMIVGDSMTQGQQGDFTWRYRIWQWFQENGVDVDFVGPYVGTVAPPPSNPGPPSPPPLANAPSPSPSPFSTSGGYAAAAQTFDSDHFAVWGRAVAVDKGLIQQVLTDHPADIILYMLGFNDVGWFYSDASGTLDSLHTFINNARAANPNIQFAVANIPQRSFIGGRQDLVDKTNIYNGLLPTAISYWTTDQSPIYLVHLQENYDCAPSSCPAGYDGLHPNELGEYQIAYAFSLCLYNDFKLGNAPLQIPGDIPARPLPAPANFQLSSSPQGVTATWDPVYGAYSYDVQSSIQGISLDFSAGSVSSNRWDSHWSLDGWVYTVQVRSAAGPTRNGPWTGSQSATAHPETAPGPNNVDIVPTSDGFTISWDPPTGPYTDSITEYNVIYWDIDSCNFITGAAFQSSPGQITGQVAGHRLFVAVETWNGNGEGFPFVANEVIPGDGTPPTPGGVQIDSFDPTSVHVTWDAVSGGASYAVWIRNVNDATSVLTRQNGTSNVACLNDYFLFPGTWNYEFCISALNGNLESGHDNCVVAPSPSATNDPGPTCPPGPQWCTDPGTGSPGDGGTTIPGGGSPSGGFTSSTLITTTLPGGSVITTSVPVSETVITTTLPGGSVITTTTEVPVSETAIVTTLPDGSVTTILTTPPAVTGSETLITTTLPGGSVITTSVPLTESEITTTLPDGSVVTTSTEVPVSETAIVTTLPDGQTTTILTTPESSFSSGSVTSTMTTLPPGVSVQDFTDFPITTNIWLTTTGQDHSTTIVPVILPCITCEPEIVWDVPEIPNVEFDWPQLPQLPTFHLPCIKIFGIHISGDCPDPSGPPPVTDGPPPDPQPSHPPNPDDTADDPCELDTSTGMCPNGNPPVFNPSTNTIDCDGGTKSQCQQNIDNNMDSIQDYLDNERSCCPAPTKNKRHTAGNVFSSLLQRGTDLLGLTRRVDFCPQQGQNPKNPPAGQCFATYTCPSIFPNVCGNAKSAISLRGATSVLTHVTMSDLHDTSPWYEGHYFAEQGDNPASGWKLAQCQVEEYPFGSGNPNRNEDGSSILRLIPGGAFGGGPGGGNLENQAHGSQLRHWVQGIATQYNNYMQQQTGRNPGIGPNGIVYCVEFEPGFTDYLPENLVNENICAQPYGPEFTLVNEYFVGPPGAQQRSWDPWFDAAPNRKSTELVHYVDSNGQITYDPSGSGTKAVYEVLPPTYCQYPSPGQQEYNFGTGQWQLSPGFSASPRDDNTVYTNRCTNPPGQGTRLRREDSALEALAGANQTRSHPRDLSIRQSSSGFLDPNVYIWLGCSDDSSNGDGDGVDPCAADGNPCGNVVSQLPTAYGVNPSQDPAPPANEGGQSTRPITSIPPSPTPTYVSCSTGFQDPDQGITSGYCVCSGSTFAQSTGSGTASTNICAYTSPLPTSTIPPPVQTITTTNTGECSVCTFVGQSETCSSIRGCTPSTTSTTSSVNPTTRPDVARIYACFSNQDTPAGPIPNEFWGEVDVTSGTPVTGTGGAFCDNLEFKTQSMGGNNADTDYPATFTVPGTVWGHTGCTYFDPSAPGPGAGSMTCSGFSTPVPCPTVTGLATSCLDGTGENIVYYTPLADCYLP